jgi:pyrroline-5-carboxylate reductase
MKLAFIGGGNMASALIGGLIGKGAKPRSVSVVEPVAAARRKLAARYKVHASAAPDARTAAADTLLLAVKPQDMRAAVGPLAGKLRGKLVISVAAGIRLKDLSRWLGGHAKLIRCMPNTPALIGAGIAGLYAPPAASAAEKRRAERILGAVGKVVWVKDEALLDPVTAVSASGPAYVFWFIEQLAATAEKLGLEKETGMKLALHTVLGAAKLAASSSEAPATLRKNVTSKGGTTEAALKVFDEEKLAERFARALEAASRRATQLGKELGQEQGKS